MQSTSKAGGSRGDAPSPASIQWLIALYGESWRQYDHEDNLVQTRTRVFLLIHGLMVTLLLGFAPSLAKWNEPGWGLTLRIGLGILGLMLMAIGSVLLVLIVYWVRSTLAGHQYLNLRWSAARAIEQRLKNLSGGVGLAMEEDRWREASKKLCDNYDQFLAFPTILDPRTPAKTSLYLYNGWGSLNAFRKLADLAYGMWVAIIVIGLQLFHGAVLWSVWPWLPSWIQRCYMWAA